MNNKEKILTDEMGLELVRVEEDGKRNGFLVFNKQFGTSMFLSLEAFEETPAIQIEKMTHCGRNVEHMTRVTGYMSKVKQWNPGKRQEFLDRYRSGVMTEPK